MKILITNDDGIKADGIRRLALAAKKYGDVWVVAPEEQRSGASHSINLHSPIRVRKAIFPVEGVTAYETSGSPADCIRVGHLNLVPGGADLILSGINYGYNAGTDLMYSGTVGAAMEGMFQGVKSIALSEPFEERHTVTDAYLETVLDKVIPMTPGAEEIINVNFPSCEAEEVKGILFDRISSKTSVFKDHYLEEIISDTESTFMVEGDYKEEAEEGSDLKALSDHYISIGMVKNIG